MRSLLVLLAALSSFLGTPAFAETEPPARWLPEACRLVIEADPRPWAKADEAAEAAEARWNRFYSQGIDALEARGLDEAEAAFCRALDAARGFAVDDIRFAETLDELGLARYSAGDFDGAEAMQGAAVVEMLLATGPPEEHDLRAAAAASCKSSVAKYMVRLGWVYDRQGRAAAIEPLLAEPYRVLALGYVPDAVILERLDWLISRYLLDEDFAAARTLRAWRQVALDRR